MSQYGSVTASYRRLCMAETTLLLQPRTCRRQPALRDDDLLLTLSSTDTVEERTPTPSRITQLASTAVLHNKTMARHNRTMVVLATAAATVSRVCDPWRSPSKS